MKEKIPYALQACLALLKADGIALKKAGDHFCFSKEDKNLNFVLSGETYRIPENIEYTVLHEDQLLSAPTKMAALIRSKLKGNKIIFARNCSWKKCDAKTAQDFLNAYHIMNATKSAFNCALVYKDEIAALASFSKGRKMNRLREDQRSYELIRFCCKDGITVAGGLTKLVLNFCREKKAGDIMTYVDKQLSDGKTFVSAGFKKHSESEPHYFLVDKVSKERTVCLNKDSFDHDKFYLSHNAGNIKLVFTP